MNNHLRQPGPLGGVLLKLTLNISPFSQPLQVPPPLQSQARVEPAIARVTAGKGEIKDQNQKAIKWRWEQSCFLGGIREGRW